MDVDLSLKPSRHFGLGIAVVLIQLFLYINADWVFGEIAPVAKNTLLVYILLQTVVIAVSGKRPEIVSGSFDRIWNFVLIFLVTAGILIVVPWVVEGWGLGATSSIPFMILQAFAVAYTEEIVFRGILANMLGDITSNVLFGVFHTSVYGASVPLIIIAVAIGFIFAVIRSKFGVMGAAGAHTAWNLKAMGILDALIKGVV